MEFGVHIDTGGDTGGFESFIDQMIEATDPSNEGPIKQGMLNAMDVYMQAERERFALASAHDGTWAEHAQSTIAKRGFGAPILNETGELEESLNRGSPGHYLQWGSDELVEGTEDRVARFHQDGAPSRNLPARPILVPPTEETLAAMKQSLMQSLQAAISEAGSRRMSIGNVELGQMFGIEMVA